MTHNHAAWFCAGWLAGTATVVAMAVALYTWGYQTFLGGGR